jgi:hypothetical protein
VKNTGYEVGPLIKPSMEGIVKRDERHIYIYIYILSWLHVALKMHVGVPQSSSSH